MPILVNPYIISAGGVGGSSVFDADSIPDLEAWFNASNVVESGGSIWEATDLSSNSVDAVQTTGTKQPQLVSSVLNGEPVMRFDGGDGLKTPSFGLGAFTIFTVSKTNSTSTQVIYQFGNSLTVGTILLNPNNNATTYKRGAGGISGENAAGGWMEPLGFIITEHYFNGTHASHGLKANGTDVTMVSNYSTQDPGTAETSMEFDIGAQNNGGGIPFNGDIAEVIVYSRDLDSSEKDDVRDYLADKYGLTV